MGFIETLPTLTEAEKVRLFKNLAEQLSVAPASDRQLILSKLIIIQRDLETP